MPKKLNPVEFETIALLNPKLSQKARQKASQVESKMLVDRALHAARNLLSWPFCSKTLKLGLRGPFGRRGALRARRERVEALANE